MNHAIAIDGGESIGVYEECTVKSTEGKIYCKIAKQEEGISLVRHITVTH